MSNFAKPTLLVSTNKRDDDNKKTKIQFHRVDTAFMNERPLTPTDFDNGGFIKWANFSIDMPPILSVNKVSLKYFKCNNTFYLFAVGYDKNGEPQNDFTTFFVEELGVHYKVELVGSYLNDGNNIASTITAILSALGSTVTCTFNASTFKYKFRSSNIFSVDFAYFNDPLGHNSPLPSYIAGILGFYIGGTVGNYTNYVYNSSFDGTSQLVESTGVVQLYYPRTVKITIRPLPQNIYDGGSSAGTFVIPLDSSPFGQPYIFTENKFYDQTVANFNTDITGYVVRIQDQFDNYLDFGGQDWDMLLEVQSSI